MERKGQHSHLTGEKHPARWWTRERIVERLIGLKADGEPINSGYLRVHHSRLCAAIRNQPGGWRRFVSEAGLDPEGEAKGRLRPSRINNEEIGS